MTCKRKRAITPKLKKEKKVGIPKLQKRLRQTTGLVLNVGVSKMMIGTAKGLR